MRTQTRPFRLAATVASWALVFSHVIPRQVSAQSTLPPAPQIEDQGQHSADPPARVGRLARVIGTVSFRTPSEDRWSPAPLNYPVTEGSAFSTQPGSQAVIEVAASRIAMAPDTELDVASLTDTAFQATAPQGELYLNLLAAAQGETVAIQTPRGVATLAVPGRYGVVVGDTESPTLVTVVGGSAHIEGPGVALDVGPSQTASIAGTDAFQGSIGPVQRDAFLAAMLNSERPPARGAPPVVAGMPGGEDLGQYGTWTASPEYGQVWYPQVAPDWVPYREGSWAYVEPWGWTWVDGAPWGFAPFHYGRWADIGGRWGWIPGGAAGPSAPVYAPALVTFLGVGAGIAVLAGSRIGWCPLGPGETYHPWYHASDRYARQINIGHVTNVGTLNRNVTINNFVNRGAATVVPASAMTASRPIAASVQHIDPAQLAQSRPVLGQQPLHPTAATLGVNPVVAHPLNPVPSTSSLEPSAPRPAVHGAITTAPGALFGHQALPALHNPAQTTFPAAAGARPFSAPPALRTAPTPGGIAPPTIERGQGPAMVNRGGSSAAVVTHPAAPTMPSPTPVVPQGRSTAPGEMAHTAPLTPPPAVIHTPPPAMSHAPAPPMVHTPPPVVQTTPMVVHAAPSPPPQFHAPAPAAPHAPPPSQNAQHKRPGEQ